MGNQAYCQSVMNAQNELKSEPPISKLKAHNFDSIALEKEPSLREFLLDFCEEMQSKKKGKKLNC